MAMRVISDESCIILLAITMRGEHLFSFICLTLSACADDIDNQEAVSLARKVDPEGRRTIG